MSRRVFFQAALAVVAFVGILFFSNPLWAQGQSDRAFDHVRQVQARHTERLMAREGVVGTAVGVDEDDTPAVLVLLEDPGVGGVPEELEGVRVHAIVTGKVYALAKPSAFSRDRTPPARPTGLKATAVSSSQINLGWAANTDRDLSYYRVYRSTSSGGPYTRIASNITAIQYSSTGLAADTTYYYVVTAVDTSGNESGYSNQASAKTLPGVVEPSPYPRPALIGVSTGHPSITAGTIGCRVTKGGLVYALSNNHVYANENRASLGDNVLQPGPYDGGQNPRDAIGTLADFQPIVFSRTASNTIDAAIALCSLATLGNSTSSYGKPSSDVVPATLGLAVKKHGRTTGLTEGQVYAVNATVNVTYSSGTARFINQIVITPGSFSAGGDSGSLIVTDDAANNPVGLLFAGSSSYTIANPIGLVLSRFNVTVDSQ
jgi:hypothetical protein